MELGGTDGVHDDVEDTELAGRQGTDHDATSAQASGGELQGDRGTRQEEKTMSLKP